jgi:predicted RNA binding protein YcfA (HicA-like mRNA interferase family)/predicted RNase H-like HicB family nuclease
MPKRYTSRELVKLAEEFGWMLVGVRGDHHNFKHPASRFIVTIVHPQKDCAGGASSGYGEENQTGAQVMRFLIMLEQTETGFAVQAPDLAISTYGENIEAAKRAAGEAIRINLEAYREAGQQAPEAQGVSNHLENPEFQDLLFAYVDVAEPQGRIAA